MQPGWRYAAVLYARVYSLARANVTRMLAQCADEGPAQCRALCRTIVIVYFMPQTSSKRQKVPARTCADLCAVTGSQQAACVFVFVCASGDMIVRVCVRVFVCMTRACLGQLFGETTNATICAACMSLGPRRSVSGARFGNARLKFFAAALAVAISLVVLQ